MELTQKQIETRKRLAQEKHETAVNSYLANPNYCQHCGEVIPLIQSWYAPVAATRRKKFCNHSCAAQHNNKEFPKRTSRSITEGSCECCGTRIKFKRNESNGKYGIRRFCDVCLKDRRKRNPDLLINRIEKMPFGELVACYGRLKARTHITRYARGVYLNSDRPQQCAICHFDYCFDVAHIKQVASFDKDALISEINSLNNLIALCPNHHRMYDGGAIDISMAIIDKMATSQECGSCGEIH
jgi:hypothetical protein